jgi:hypothetical protein
MRNNGNLSKDGGGSGVSCRVVVFLLITILAHGVMVSFENLGSVNIMAYYNTICEQKSSVPTETKGSKNNNDDRDNNPASFSSLSSTSSLLRRIYQKLPHWRIAVDCSVYNLDCFSRGQRELRYLPYPFPPPKGTEKEEAEQLRVEIVREFPKEWSDILQHQPITSYSDTPKVTIQDQHNLYPPMVDEAVYQKCLDFTGVVAADSDVAERKSTLEQLDQMLTSQRLMVEPDTNMMAFTTSDASYTKDMIHDFFQMMDLVVGFSQKHFVMIALDVTTVQLACRHGYPVIFWRESNQKSLRDAVANTKVVLSLELIKRGISFFFTEMDVWWIQSPKPSLMAFQQLQEDQLVGNHLYFSAHQKNPWAANIGVYASKANKYTQEYFEICMDILKQRPKTHDQWVLQQVHDVFEKSLRNESHEFVGDWGQDKSPPPVPNVTWPFKARFWSPHDIAADQRPTPTHETMAIHTLCHTPLLNPHGKKMLARELGVYYGFTTEPKSYFAVGVDDSGFQQSVVESAGYYTRIGDRHRRYVALDGPSRTNFYSMCPDEIHNNAVAFQWTVTMLMVIARWSNRILILPQVFISQMDAGS